MFIYFFFNATATTEIYTTYTLFPYTTRFRSYDDCASDGVAAEQGSLRPAKHLHGLDVEGINVGSRAGSVEEIVDDEADDRLEGQTIVDRKSTRLNSSH